VSKLAVFLIRLATDPDVRDQFRTPETKAALIERFRREEALGPADVKALEAHDLSGILGAIATSNQQTDGTAVRVCEEKRAKRKARKSKK
jgi:hypothetical protein